MNASSSKPLLRIILRTLIPLAILMGGFGALFGLLQLRAQPSQAPAGQLIPGVSVVSPQLHNDGFILVADGVVVPFREATVSAEVAGRIIEKSPLCEAGNYVSKGTPLIKIDSTDYDIELRRLNVILRQSGLAIDELDEQVEGTQQLAELARADVALRQRELQRQKDLGTVARATEVERAEGNLLLSRNTLQSLQNQISRFAVQRTVLEATKELSGVQLEKAQRDLERTEIVAPVSGVIVQESVEQDGFVQRGAALFTIEDTSRVEVASKLEMEDLFWLWSSRRAPANADTKAWTAYAFPGPMNVDVVYRVATGTSEFIWPGRLERFDGVGLDENTRTAPVRVVVREPQREGDGPPALVRGMYVELRIPVKPKVKLWRVPQASFRAGNVIWVVRNGKLFIEPANFVRQLPIDESGAAEVLIYTDDPDRLTADSQIAVSPLAFVKSGLQVNVATETDAANDTSTGNAETE